MSEVIFTGSDDPFPRNGLSRILKDLELTEKRDEISAIYESRDKLHRPIEAEKILRKEIKGKSNLTEDIIAKFTNRIISIKRNTDCVDDVANKISKAEIQRRSFHNKNSSPHIIKK